MSVHILEEDIQKVYKVARELPSYKATIAAEDYTKLLVAIGITQTADELKATLDFTTTYTNGRLEVEKVLWYARYRTNDDPIKLVELAVDHLDPNNTGYAGINDIKSALDACIVHNSKVKDLFQAKNGEKFLTNNSKDGKVKLDEFKKWLNQK